MPQLFCLGEGTIMITNIWLKQNPQIKKFINAQWSWFDVISVICNFNSKYTNKLMFSN